MRQGKGKGRFLLLGLQQKNKGDETMFQSILRYFTFSPQVQDLAFSFLELYKDFVG